MIATARVVAPWWRRLLAWLTAERIEVYCTRCQERIDSRFRRCPCIALRYLTPIQPPAPWPRGERPVEPVVPRPPPTLMPGPGVSSPR